MAVIVKTQVHIKIDVERIIIYNAFVSIIKQSTIIISNKN